MTWLLVSTSPLDVRMMPVPFAVPAPPASVVVTSTTAGSTLAATADVPPAPADVDGDGVVTALDVCGNDVLAAGVTRVEATTTTPAAAPAVMLPRKTKAATIGKRRGGR